MLKIQYKTEHNCLSSCHEIASKLTSPVFVNSMAINSSDLTVFVKLLDVCKYLYDVRHFDYFSPCTSADCPGESLRSRTNDVYWSHMTYCRDEQK